MRRHPPTYEARGPAPLRAIPHESIPSSRVDVETDEPMFGTVKEGLIGRHMTFVPLAGLTFGPDALQMAVTREQVRSAPNIELQGDEVSRADESALYHHYELNYTPPDTESGRRLARR
jgi:hypothetical protein